MNCCSGISYIYYGLDYPQSNERIQSNKKEITSNNIRICSVEVAGFPVALGKSTLIYRLGQNLEFKHGFSKLDLHCVTETMCLLNPQKNHIVVFLDDVLHVAKLPPKIISVVPLTDEMSHESKNDKQPTAACCWASYETAPSFTPNEHLNVARFKSLAQSNVPHTNNSNSLYNNLLCAFQTMCYAQNSLAAAYNQQISCVVSEITSRYSNLLVGDSKITLVFSRRIMASMALFTMSTVLREFPLLLPILNLLDIEGNIETLAQVESSYFELMADKKRHPCWRSYTSQLKNSDLCNLNMIFTHFVQPYLNVNLLKHVNYGYIYKEGVFDLEMFLLKNHSEGDRRSLLEKCYINMSKRGRKFEKELYSSEEEFCKFFNLYSPENDVYMEILSNIVSFYETNRVCCTGKPFNAASVERRWDKLNDVKVNFRNYEDLMQYVIETLSRHFV